MPSETGSGQTRRGTDAVVLGFDTSGNWCCAALVQGDAVLAARTEAMGRGQGERLVVLLEELLAEAGLRWGDLGALGVGVGPGNFTGIRISVSAARGLALGLGIPAVGVNRFDALALEGAALPVLVPAPRGQGWLHRDGMAPMLCDPAQLTGPVIAEAGAFGVLDAHAPRWPIGTAIARIAARRRHQPQPRPAPLYLREPDAAAPAEGPPALLP
ncbi:MAG: tRNA (adenosine(37)-N6)-threonylcarbamoyltransferase complex dimerization subunit type 1 TsaB [Pararhodobacter sp.]